MYALNSTGIKIDQFDESNCFCRNNPAAGEQQSEWEVWTYFFYRGLVHCDWSLSVLNWVVSWWSRMHACVPVLAAPIDRSINQIWMDVVRKMMNTVPNWSQPVVNGSNAAALVANRGRGRASNWLKGARNCMISFADSWPLKMITPSYTWGNFDAWICVGYIHRERERDRSMSRINFAVLFTADWLGPVSTHHWNMGARYSQHGAHDDRALC